MTTDETRPAGDQATWRAAVAGRSMFDLDLLWRPRWRIGGNHPVATFGCDFAQHLGPALARHRLTWVVAEPAPDGLSEEGRRRFGYDSFSCRTGVIPTPSLLLQWVEWALDEVPPPAEHWRVGERVYDPFRPAVEAGGFDSVDEMLASRAATITCFREAVEQAAFVVFTLGRNESWLDAEHGWEYPVRPAPVGEELDAACHRGVSWPFDRVCGSLLKAFERMRAVRHGLKFILTVAPTPLARTDTGHHPLVASTGSQAVLRTAAGELADRRKFVEYFPAFELIASPVFRGVFYDADQRTVTSQGIDFVLDAFFAALDPRWRPRRRAAAREPQGRDDLPQGGTP